MPSEHFKIGQELAKSAFSPYLMHVLQPLIDKFKQSIGGDIGLSGGLPEIPSPSSTVLGPSSVANQHVTHVPGLRTQGSIRVTPGVSGMGGISKPTESPKPSEPVSSGNSMGIRG